MSPVGGVHWRGESVGRAIRRVLGFRLEPPHCSTCGDEMVPDSYSTGYDRRGNPTAVKGMRCPRHPAGYAPFGFYGVGGYWNDCFPPMPLIGGDHGEPPSQAAIDQYEAWWAAYNAHRPWQDVR